ncbi:class I SAM-dependent methyltransferase [bacterium]|nr:class I SAM-dependent methyltransferase [bacterium]
MMSHEKETWYANWFNDIYAHIYAHRDRLSANREAAFALTLLGGVPEGPVLDLCCGAGRHSHALAAAGCRVVGLDLSPWLLSEARSFVASPGGRLSLVRGDMRSLPFSRAFSGVFNFFTSFGYFDDEENREVLREIARVLLPGGFFLLDYMNAPAVIAGLVPCSERETELGKVVESRTYDPESRRIEKDLYVYRSEGEMEAYHESVRAYTCEEMLSLLSVVGLCPLSVYGTLDGAAYTEKSPRMVIFGRTCA